MLTLHAGIALLTVAGIQHELHSVTGQLCNEERAWDTIKEAN
jgi:hypothetical protein